MTSEEYLAGYGARIDALIDRCRAALDGLTVDQWNAKIDNPWTIAQILEHIHIAAAPYVPAIQKSIEAAPRGPGGPLKHTFFGNLIIKSAGPGGKGPAPKQMIPPDGPYDAMVLERFETVHRRFQDLAQAAKGVDLNAGRVPVPVMPFLKFNLGDAFEIMAVHTDRHVGQIETFAKTLRG